MDFKKKIERLQSEKHKRQRRTRYKRNEDTKSDFFMTQAAVSTVLIICVLFISRVDSNFTNGLSAKLKTAISDQTSIETMKSTADESKEKVGGIKDFFKGLFKKEDIDKEKEIDKGIEFVDDESQNTEEETLKEKDNIEVFTGEFDDLGKEEAPMAVTELID